MKVILRYALMVAFVFSGVVASARQISSSEALQRVISQWPARAAHRAPAKTAFSVHELPGAYVFAQGDKGFIVSPADDSMPAVLAYTDNGRYDEQQLPPAFRAWLSEITQYGPAKVPAKVSASAIDPLLGEIAWTQDTPMNDLCPRYYYGGYNYPTYAGCVAIAMGQIMRYHQHPAQGSGSVSYQTDTYSIPVETDLSAHTYDWSKILPNYIYTTPTSENRAEVAKLVFDVAAATQMDFSPGASNTQDFRAAQALVKNFDYDPSLQLIDHRFYSTTQWAEILRAELNAKRPVYLSGANVSDNQVAGHAFVVDGYNAEGYYHINWGWNGSSNGYYLLTDLTPKDKQGIGGSNNGYAFMQNAIIGIQKNFGGTPAQASICLIYEQVWMERDEKGTSVNFQLANPTAVDFTGIIALRITDKNGQMLTDPMNTALRLTCKAGYSGERGWYVDLSQLGAGCTFELVYRLEEEEEWHVAGARTGSPHSLVSYTEQGGSVALGHKTSELFQMSLVDLQTEGTLTAGSQATFTATVKNESDYEYFAPLYLMVYDADGTLVGYTDYQLYLVPAHGQAEVKFDYTLPSEAGSYHFCVSYETLGYNYDYSPMLRQGTTDSYDYIYNVVKAGGGGGGGTPGLGTVDYVMQCIDYGADAVRRDIKVRFEGKDVYFQGISEEVPEAWAHATMVDGVAVFDAPQKLGEWTSYGRQRTQYLTGADTGTGDVSGFEMLYDDDARSFVSFSNNWILLTSDPTQVGYYYDHLYNSISFIPANQAGDDPTITPPNGLATSSYQVKGRHPYSGIPTDYTVSVGFVDNEVYVQGLYPAFPSAWIKGKVEDGKATFQTPQFVGNYHGLYNMYIAGVNPSTEVLETLVMDYNAASRTFSSVEECWFIVQAGETNIMPMMLLDAVTIAPYQTPAVSTTVLTVPVELEQKAQPYSFSATNADTNAPVQGDAWVITDGDDVYVQGISTYFPQVWVKGHRDGVIVVFPRGQFMGALEGNNLWLGAGDTMSGEMLYGNFILQLNPATGEYIQPDVNYLAINASTTKVYHLELYSGVRLTPLQEDGVLQTTDNGQRTTDNGRCFDLQGRAYLRQPQSGLYIQRGRKVIR